MNDSRTFPTVGYIRNLIEKLYPPELAESWDKVGLICGNPDQPVKKLIIALDPVKTTVDEAVENHADMLLTHHPLYLRGTSFLPANDPKGALIHSLIKRDCALLNAHTNADAAAEGVAYALAKRVGIDSSQPLVPSEISPKLGLGRVGELEQEISLEDFARKVAQALPGGPNGLLVGGDLKAKVKRVVVSGGAGDGFLSAARAAEGDVYVTADLRHHPASEHLAGGKPYLINASHWATEYVWCEVAAESIQRELSKNNLTCEVIVSKLVTEPWSLWLPTTERG